MTEVEKLRELLREARDVLSQGCWSGKCCKVRENIDAALSEPVEDYESLYRTNVRCECGDDDACLLARQRDEARAEVEREKESATRGWQQADSLHLTVKELGDEIEQLRKEVRLLKNHYSLEAASKLRAEVASARSITALREHERDEARAEVERLRADVVALEAGITAQDEVLTRRYNEQLSRAKEAYQRGAEAMREAAAKELNRLLTKKKATAIWVSPEEIRSVPLPEESL